MLEIYINNNYVSRIRIKIRIEIVGYPKEMKLAYKTDVCTPMFIVALLIISKINLRAMDEWMKKM